MNCLVETHEINLLTGKSTIVNSKIVDEPKQKVLVRILAEKILEDFQGKRLSGKSDDPD
jgi:hypothetical protein